MNRDKLNGSSRERKLSDVSLPLFCDECSRQCKGGARRRNCDICKRLTANRIEHLEIYDKKSSGTSGHCNDSDFWDFNSCNDEKSKEVASCSGVLSYSSVSSSYKKASFVNDSDSSDNDEADKFCVYTYKGLDVSSQNDKTHQNRDSSAQRSSSSEMDYLEMDFDPGTSNGHDYCDDSGQSVSSGQGLFQDTNDCFLNTCNACNPSCISHSNCSIDQPCSMADHSDIPDKIEECIDEFTHLCVDSDALAISPSSRTVLECSNICLNSHISGNESSTSDGANSEHSYLTAVSKADDITPDSSELVNNALEPLLENINFDNKEAFVSQVNLPSVKASSIRGKNILSINPSDDFNQFLIESLESYQELVDLRPKGISTVNIPQASKDETHADTKLQDFILFQLNGNPTFADYIENISENYFARWFPTYPPRNINLCKFILHWISRGAVPILTFLSNSDPEELSYDWSHKLVEGSNHQLILFKSPSNFETEENLTSKLSLSPLVRVSREQIMTCYSYSSDLHLLSDIENKSLQKYNVLGQVANVIRESFVWNDKSTRFITLPSKFLPGISIVIEKCNSYVTELKDFPDLPILSET